MSRLPQSIARQLLLRFLLLVAVAGCDSLCIVEPENVKPVFTNLLEAARQGKITPERLNEAVKRNLEFMAWLGLFEDPMVSAEDALELLENEADNALLRKVTGRSEPEAITTTEQDPPQTAPSAPATTRFGISADAHLMKSAPPEHEAFFRRFVDAMVEWKPDFVIDLGDFACQCPGGKTTPAMHDCQLEGLKRHFALWGPLPGPSASNAGPGDDSDFFYVQTTVQLSA